MKAEELNQLIVRDKFIIAAAIVVLFVTIFNALAGFVLAIVFIMAGVGLKIYQKKTSVDELREKKNALVDELAQAEKNFMTRKLNEKAYKELSEELQRKLISIEAEIEIRKMSEGFRKLAQVKTKKLEPKRRHNLMDLLKESEVLMKELNIANAKYLKRKIDEKTYRAISTEKQKRLVGIQSEINRLYREEASDIMEDTQRKLALSEEAMLKEKAMDIVEDLMEQKGIDTGQNAQETPRQRHERRGERQ